VRQSFYQEFLMHCFFTSLVLLLSLPVAIHAADCTPTPHRTTGTHYKPVTVEKTDIGQGVLVKGQVLSAPDCKPVPGAKVAHWQAGEEGQYVDRLRTYLFTDENGYFKFNTEWPNMRTPHIHFIIEAKGHELLETQWIGDERTDKIEFDLILQRQ